MCWNATRVRVNQCFLILRHWFASTLVAFQHIIDLTSIFISSNPIWCHHEFGSSGLLFYWFRTDPNDHLSSKKQQPARSKRVHVSKSENVMFYTFFWSRIFSELMYFGFFRRRHMHAPVRLAFANVCKRLQTPKDHPQPHDFVGWI